MRNHHLSSVPGAVRGLQGQRHASLKPQRPEVGSGFGGSVRMEGGGGARVGFVGVIRTVAAVEAATAAAAVRPGG